MLGRHVVDQLLDDDRLADAGPAEQADLTALKERLDQVDHLDAGLEHFLRGRLLVELRRLPMDRHVHLRVQRTKLIDRLAQHIQHAAQRLAPDRHHDAVAGIDRLHPANHTLGRHHRDAAYATLAQVLLHLDHYVQRSGHVEPIAHNPQRLKDRRHLRFFKLHVNGRAADRNDFSNIFVCHSLLSLLLPSCNRNFYVPG